MTARDRHVGGTHHDADVVRCERKDVHDERRFMRKKFESGFTQCHREAHAEYNFFAESTDGVAAKMNLCEECAEEYRHFNGIESVEVAEVL